MEENKTAGNFISKIKPISTKDTLRLDTLMNHFISKKVHIAFIYDEYSTFIGVVTLEEIIKVEIVDEVDLVVDMQHLAIEQSKLNIFES